MLEVLDHGYVRIPSEPDQAGIIRPLIMGSDLSVVNAAKASFKKESLQFGNAEQRLLKFLVTNDHMSPFRHAFVTLEIKAPIMVCRQWWKYVVGSDHTMDGWNEASGRYIEYSEGYVPASFRKAPENKKQGSGGPVAEELNIQFINRLIHAYDEAYLNYKEALAQGICAEQARLFLLGFGSYTVWRWSASLQSVCHFLQQRIADDAQLEIQAYALATKQLLLPWFAKTMEAF